MGGRRTETMLLARVSGRRRLHRSMNTFASLGKASRTRTIVKTTSLPFGVNSAYEAVARVHQYPEFLSWCTRVDIVEEPRSLPGSVEKLVCAIDYGVTGSDRLDLSAIGYTICASSLSC